MNKPREWWIEFTGDPPNDKENYKRYVGGEKFDSGGFDVEVVHVIEKAAYDELKIQLDIAKDALAKIGNPSKRDHSEPDLYTRYGCVLNMANEALDNINGIVIDKFLEDNKLLIQDLKELEEQEKK